MNYINSVKEGEIIAYADVSLFSKEAIFKCIYWYGDNFHARISLADSPATPDDFIQQKVRISGMARYGPFIKFN